MTATGLGFRLLAVGALAAVLVWLGSIAAGALVPALRSSIGCSSGLLLAWLLLCGALAFCIRPVKL